MEQRSCLKLAQSFSLLGILRKHDSKSYNRKKEFINSSMLTMNTIWNHWSILKRWYSLLSQSIHVSKEVLTVVNVDSPLIHSKSWIDTTNSINNKVNFFSFFIWILVQFRSRYYKSFNSEVRPSETKWDQSSIFPIHPQRIRTKLLVNWKI